MPCDLALTIQIVGVEDETLLGLLTPELQIEVIKLVLTDLGIAPGYVYSAPQVRVESNGYPGYSITVQQGRVRVNGGRDRDKITAIGNAVGAGLRELGIALLGTKVQEALSDLSEGAAVEVTETTAEENGQVFPVQVLTVSW